MTAPSLPPAEPRPGNVGRAPKGELAIRGDKRLFLPPGQVGQIMLRGPSVTPGYLQDIDGVPGGLENGWLLSGDLGSLDEDGFLTIVGRTKEIINRGGEKISPYDVEKALLRHPAVREAAAFSVPHPRLGENVVSGLTPDGAALRERGLVSLWAITRRILRKDRSILERVVRRLLGGGGDSRQSSYYKAMAKYLPPPIDSEAVCLMSDEYSTKKEYSAAAWKSLSRSVQLETVPGRHNTCITTHVGELATTMSRLLVA